MPTNHTYLVANLIVGIFFLIIFWRNPKLRREMLVVGTGLGLLSLLLSQTFIRDYWSPVFYFGSRFPIEEFLYGFSLGGVAAVIYSVCVRGEKYVQRRKEQIPNTYFASAVFVAIAVLIAGTWLADMTSMHLGILILLLTSVVIISLRNDLLIVAFVSGLFTFGITLFGFLLLLVLYPQFVDTWWKQSALSGYEIFGVPIEELYWSFFLGFCAGPVYELRHGLVYRNVSKKRSKSG